MAPTPHSRAWSEDLMVRLMLLLWLALLVAGCAARPAVEPAPPCAASVPELGAIPGPELSAMATTQKPPWVHYADWWDEYPLLGAAAYAGMQLSFFIMLGLASLAH